MAFSVSHMAVAVTVATGALLSAITSANAQEFGFGFDSQVSKSTVSKDVFLESIKIGDQVIQDFSYVSKVEIIENDPFLGGNTGAASADKGTKTTTGVYVEAATAESLLTNLSNNNLNNIVDTEDTGSFVIDLTFEKVIDNLLIWERGMNSKLGIQALDNNNNLIGERLVIDATQWQSAGFSILTQELVNSKAPEQQVGSLGINILADLGVEGGVSKIRFFSEESFNGPDWKFVGTEQKVPEPTLILGLGMLSGAFIMQKRRAA